MTVLKNEIHDILSAKDKVTKRVERQYDGYNWNSYEVIDNKLQDTEV